MAGKQRAVRSLQLGIDLGLTHIDTAEMYGSGAVESIVGQAIKEHRDRVFLVSKVMPRPGTAEIVNACHNSLRRLQTDRLDCYLLHWPGRYNLGYVAAAFERLLSQGKILSFGVSNFEVAHLQHFEQLVGANRIACNQIPLRLDQPVAADVQQWCQRRSVAIVGYGSLRDLTRTGHDLKAIIDLAKKKNVSIHMAILASLLSMTNAFLIPKAIDPVHIRDNAHSAKLTWPDDEIASLLSMNFSH